MSTIGSSTTTVTLSAHTLDVTLVGVINAYGEIATGTVNGTLTTFDAAVLGPLSKHFTVTNAGLVESKGSHAGNPDDSGIFLANSGTVANDGTITGGVGVHIGGKSGTTRLFNTGLIEGGAGAAADLSGSAIIENQAGGVLAGTAAGAYARGKTTIVNAGTISGDTGSGLYFAAAGRLTNTGVVTGKNVGVVTHGAARISNTGLIDSTGSSFVLGGQTLLAIGLAVDDGGDVVNAGTIMGIAGLDLKIGGTLKNTGVILGQDFGAVAKGAAKISNAGLIETTGGQFVYGAATLDPTALLLDSGGAITNTGTIEGAVGIFVKAGGTIIDSGTIVAGHDAIYFTKGFANQLRLDPRAKITGQVVGGGGAISLEQHKKKIGTIEVSQFSGFASVTVDKKSVWDFSGSGLSSFATTLIDDGTIKESAADDVTISGALEGTGLVELSKHGLGLDGAVSSGEAIKFSGTGETLALGDAGGFAGSIETFGTGDLVDLTGLAFASIKSHHFADGVLTLSELSGSITLTFSNPGTFQGKTLTVEADGDGTGIVLSSKAKYALLPPLHMMAYGEPLSSHDVAVHGQGWVGPEGPGTSPLSLPVPITLQGFQDFVQSVTASAHQ